MESPRELLDVLLPMAHVVLVANLVMIVVGLWKRRLKGVAVAILIKILSGSFLIGILIGMASAGEGIRVLFGFLAGAVFGYIFAMWAVCFFLFYTLYLKKEKKIGQDENVNEL